MGTNKALIMLGAGMLIALLASIFVYGWLQKRSHVQVQAAETQPVVVAAVDLPWGTVLSTNVVKTEPFLKKSLPAGSFTDPAAIEGRTLLYPVKTGELMLESSLAPTTLKGGGVAAIITPKKRAMAVKVDKVVGVSGFIYPGHRVDVLVTLSQAGGGSTGPITKIVLEDVLVLAAGTQMEKSGNQEKPAQVDVITLELTPEEGEKLALASTEGKLQLALRNATDNAEVMTRGTTIPVLLASYGSSAPERRAAQSTRAVRPAPVPAKPEPFTVELIRGTALSSVKFQQGE